MSYLSVLALVLFSSTSMGADRHEMVMTPEAIPTTWKTCTQNQDCKIGIMGCWEWVALNKVHVGSDKGIFGGNYIVDANSSCLKSHEPGPKPKAICDAGKCKIVRSSDNHSI